MHNISSQELVTISKVQYNDLQREIKKLSAQVKLSYELQKGLVSSLEGVQIPAERAVGKLGFDKYES
ncbi:MAG: hypothetical protein LBV19_10070 [Streptococcaceae bacterium]|jgi:hypothetical protein|nr:hypothetical protein [Streptococcaceae bacterium]